MCTNTRLSAIQTDLLFCLTSCNWRASHPHAVFQIHVLLLLHLFRLSRKLLLIFKMVRETCGVSHWGFVVVSNGDARGETRSPDESPAVMWRVPHRGDKRLVLTQWTGLRQLKPVTLSTCALDITGRETPAFPSLLA